MCSFIVGANAMRVRQTCRLIRRCPYPVKANGDAGCKSYSSVAFCIALIADELNDSPRHALATSGEKALTSVVHPVKGFARLTVT